MTPQPHELDSQYPDTWTKAKLVEPPASGFLHLALSTGTWKLPPALPSTARRRLRDRLLAVAEEARVRPGVTEAHVFTVLVRPPGGGQAGSEIAYDVVLLIETTDVAAAESLAGSDWWKALAAAAQAESQDSLEFVASSPRRIAAVDHDRPGVFLFNYFSAPTVEKNLFAWQYTAGWFQDQTGLDNSTVMQPANGDPFTLVNHCRWDHLVDIMPSLVFKKSFREFVLKIFGENGVEPRPLLYRLAG